MRQRRARHLPDLDRLDRAYLAVLAASFGSVFPELFDMFGERAFRLVDVFGGQTIRIPTRRELECALSDVALRDDLAAARTREQRQAVRRRYGVSRAEARTRVGAIETLIQGLRR